MGNMTAAEFDNIWELRYTCISKKMEKFKMTKRIKNTLLAAGMTVCLLIFFACWLLSVRWFLLSGLAATAALCTAYILFKRMGRRLTARRANVTFAGACVILLAAQIYLAATAGYHPAISDPKIYGDLARRFAENGSFAGGSEGSYIYMSRYPNTWGMLFLTTGWYTIWYRLGGEITELTGQIFDILAVQTAAVFCYLTARRIFRENGTALLCGLTAAFCPVYLLFTPVFHSDIISVGFVSPAVYLLTRAYSESGRKRWLCFAGAALLLAAGNSVKGSIVIVTIAAVLTLLLRFPLRTAACASAMLIGATVLCGTLTMQIGLASGLTNEEKLNEYRFPMVHWIMMGINDKGGGHTKHDVDYTDRAGDFRHKRRADRAELRRRIESLDTPQKIYDLYSYKVYRTWNDGGRRYGKYLSACKPTSALTRRLIGSDKTRDVCRIYNSGVMLGVLLSMLYTRRRTSKPALRTAAMSLAGFILFLLMWESTARYTITYLPIMQLLNTAGVRYTSETIRIRLKGLRRRK